MGRFLWLLTVRQVPRKEAILGAAPTPLHHLPVACVVTHAVVVPAMTMHAMVMRAMVMHAMVIPVLANPAVVTPAALGVVTLATVMLVVVSVHHHPLETSNLVGATNPPGWVLLYIMLAGRAATHLEVMLEFPPLQVPILQILSFLAQLVHMVLAGASATTLPPLHPLAEQALGWRTCLQEPPQQLAQVWMWPPKLPRKSHLLARSTTHLSTFPD